VQTPSYASTATAFLDGFADRFGLFGMKFMIKVIHATGQGGLVAAFSGPVEEWRPMDDHRIETISELRGVYGPLPENSLAARIVFARSISIIEPSSRSHHSW